MSRTSKQHKASVNRINLENKSNREASKIITKQYELIGRKLPQKLQDGRANHKDMEKYLQTVKNTLDRRIVRDELKGSGIEKQLKQLNSLNDKRKSAMEKNLEGYDKNLIDAYTQGKLISIGRDVTSAMTSTNHLDKDRIKNLAKLNNIKDVKKFLNMRIKAMKEDLKNIEQLGNDNGNYIVDTIKTTVESYGYSLSEDNITMLKRRINNLDYLGKTKLSKIVAEKMNNRFYEIYKDRLDMNDNDKLIEEFINDINKSKRSNINQYYRILT